MVHLNPIHNGGAAMKRDSVDMQVGSMVLPVDSSGYPTVYIDGDTGHLVGGSGGEYDTGTSDLDTFVDRICRGYTPYAEREDIGVTEVLS
jgi:hypothetical protein